MAFHRGTVRALHDLGVVDAIDVVSTVSGGSVFGAAWLCALAAAKTTPAFLAELEPVLTRGFVRPALWSPRALRLLLPGANRTRRLAETFDEILTGHRRLGDLPERPRLCMNASVLNHAEVGRFSRNGFSCRAVGKPEVSGSYPETAVPVTVGFAAAASAAFPFGLPPLSLPTTWLPAFEPPIADHRTLVLTDGGVIENLGVQVLLRSHRFRTNDIIVSDAGTAQTAWKPTFVGRLKSFAAFALSRDTLSQLLAVMNEKQNKSMRQLVVRDVTGLAAPQDDRALWFIRVDQQWDDFVRGVSASRRRRIAGEGKPVPDDTAGAAKVVAFLESHGIDLGEARSHYDAMGGDAGARRANQVETNFTALGSDVVALLERHAMWQVHACRAVYGPIGERRDATVEAIAPAT